ncbi:MAG TPA: hypothetical protein VH478_16045 [Trebonia sp.]|nr:hypothetical protein [Trebonia sp.]
MQPDQIPAPGAGAGAGTDLQDGPLPGAGRLAGAERHQEVQRALADALALTRLQAELLVRLQAADRDGDDDTVLRCHAELDHVMARMSEADQARNGALAAAEASNDLACAGCGAAAEPVYEKPDLLGYRCTGCGWQGDDPAAQAGRKHAEALAAAAQAAQRAVPLADEALASLARRGKQAHADGIATLRKLHADLSAADRRLRNN